MNISELAFTIFKLATITIAAIDLIAIAYITTHPIIIATIIELHNSPETE